MYSCGIFIIIYSVDRLANRNLQKCGVATCKLPNPYQQPRTTFGIFTEDANIIPYQSVVPW